MSGPYITGNETRFVEYHTAAWELLVETGWNTKFVDELNGKRIATMQFIGRWTRYI